MHELGIPLEEVQTYSGLSNASLRLYVRMGLLPAPRVERRGHGTTVWYSQEVIGLLTVIMRLKRRGMKLRNIAELITQRDVVEGDEARAMASSPMLSDDIITVALLGTQLRDRLSDREVVVAVFDTEEREGQQVMVPVKIVHLPRS